jgi:DeoR family transcriptional regulator, fructose operon transcriptional repressor
LHELRLRQGKRFRSWYRNVRFVARKKPKFILALVRRSLLLVIENEQRRANMSKVNRLAAERKEKIREYVRRDGVARIEDLCRDLEVSPATVRRDLAELHRSGALRRVHGGAIGGTGSLAEPLFEDKTATAEKEKGRIARQALTLIKPADCVFLDGGSTVLALARLLKDRPSLTVATNSLRVAELFADSGPQTVLLGGELRRISQTFVGPLSAPLMRQLHPDIAFLGALGVSAQAGMTTTDPREALTKSIVLEQARQAILLAHGEKIGQVSFVKFGELRCLSALVTDKSAPPAERNRIARKGTRVLVA